MHNFLDPIIPDPSYAPDHMGVRRSRPAGAEFLRMLNRIKQTGLVQGLVSSVA